MKKLFLAALLLSAGGWLRAQDSLRTDTIKNEVQISVLPLLQAATGTYSDQPGLGILYKRGLRNDIWLRVGFSQKRLGGDGSLSSNYEIIGFTDSTEVRKYSSYGQYWRRQVHLGVEKKLGEGRVRQYIGADLLGGWFSQSYTEYTQNYHHVVSNNILEWQPVDSSITKTLERETKFVLGGLSAFYGVQFLLTNKLYLNTQFQADLRMVYASQVDTVNGVSGTAEKYSVFDFSIPGLLGDIAIGYRF